MSHEHDELPIPDFDHVLIGHLPSRIASLDADQLGALLEYERAHAHRLPVTEVLEHRIAALEHGAHRSDAAAGDLPSTSAPGGGSKVSRATAGPPIDPALTSVLGNPTQR